MPPTQPQVFSGITPEQFSTLSAKAHTAGIEISGNTGTASKFGVEVSWDYSPAARKLTLHCIRTPFFVKQEDVDAKIHALVKETLG